MRSRILSITSFVGCEGQKRVITQGLATLSKAVLIQKEIQNAIFVTRERTIATFLFRFIDRLVLPRMLPTNSPVTHSYIRDIFA